MLWCEKRFGDSVERKYMNTLTQTPKSSRRFIELGLIAATSILVSFFFVQNQLPIANWVCMWLVALLVYGFCKLLTFARYSQPTNTKLIVHYFIFEPGLNANKFFAPRNAPIAPITVEWAKGLTFATFGLVFIYYFSPLMEVLSSGLAATTGMIGIVMLLHFGVLDLLSKWLRTKGFDSTALMNDPWRAVSVAEFWSRWNTGFRDFSRQMIFYPLVRRKQAHAGLWFTFLFSGLIHDLVISLPAGGGYGGPTLYFLLQAVAIDIERSHTTKRFQLTKGLRGWLWTASVILLPVSLLFHQPFRENVVLPMLRDLGALS